MENRRASIRIDVDRSARVWLKDGADSKECAEGRIRNVSEDGVCFKIPTEFSVGEDFTIEFMLESTESEIILCGKVMWNRQAQDGQYIHGARMFMESGETSPAMQSEITHLINREAARVARRA